MDGFVCSISEMSQGWSLWRGRAEHAPIRTSFRGVGHQGIWVGVYWKGSLFRKDLVIVEIALIEDDAVERVALAAGVRICLCPMTKQVRAARCPSRSDNFSECLCSCPSRIST